MAAPVKINFKVYQGSTFREVLRWESSTKSYATITGITKTAPVVITAPAHGVPIGWRAKVTNVLGMKEINCTDEQYYTVTDTTSDTVTFNSVNAVGFSTYTSGGILEYNQPVDLLGMTARMQIREKLDSEIILASLTTENGKILIDNTYKTITVQIPALETEDFAWTTAIYSLELINGADVIPFIYGNMVLDKEVTR